MVIIQKSAIFASMYVLNAQRCLELSITNKFNYQ